MVDMGQDRSNPFPTVAIADLVPLTNFTPKAPTKPMSIPTPNSIPAPTMPTPTPTPHFPIALSLNAKDCDLLTHILQNEVTAHHNWIASAIDNKDFDRAANLTRELRAYQSIATNLRRTIREAHENAAKADAARLNDANANPKAPSFNDL